MTLRFRTWAPASAVAALSLALLSCGGASEEPSTPTASPTPPVAQATPTPAPTPTPTVDPAQSNLAPGPVSQVKVYLKTVESSRGTRDYRDAEKGADGMWILYVGEYVVVDSTPFNAAGQVCRFKKDPAYSWDNFDDMMDVKSSSEPFFFKFEVARTGVAEVSSMIDGVESNDLKMRALPRR